MEIGQKVKLNLIGHSQRLLTDGLEDTEDAIIRGIDKDGDICCELKNKTGTYSHCLFTGYKSDKSNLIIVYQGRIIL